jgi:ligand-binding SRPBCC domain-containing protein
MEQLELFDKPDPAEGFLDGVKVLLARMDSNPEEFGAMNNAWSELMRTVLEDRLRDLRTFTDEEIQAVEKKLNWVYRQNFSSRVFKNLMQDDEQEKPRSAAIPIAQLSKQALELMNKQFEQEYARQYKLKSQP